MSDLRPQTDIVRWLRSQFLSQARISQRMQIGSQQLIDDLSAKAEEELYQQFNLWSGSG